MNVATHDPATDHGDADAREYGTHIRAAAAARDRTRTGIHDLRAAGQNRLFTHAVEPAVLSWLRLRLGGRIFDLFSLTNLWSSCYRWRRSRARSWSPR